MKYFNLPLISDTLFLGFCAFALVFTSMRYFVESAYMALALGIFAFLVFAALAYLIISGRQRKKRLYLSNQRERKLLKTHLALLSKTEAAKTVAPAIDGFIRVERSRICANERVYYPMFSFEKLTNCDIAEALKRRCGKKRAILCNDLSSDAETLAKKFDIEIVRTDDIFEKLKKAEALPQKYLYEDAEKRGALHKIKSRFNKKLTPALFISGISLILLSYFTFFPIYYVISGSILTSLSMVALFIS